MSEHPELREALIEAVKHVRNSGGAWQPSAAYADALLAGPVGKLQAEIERLTTERDEADETNGILLDRCVVLEDEVAQLTPPDPERIRREAIGAAFEAETAPMALGRWGLSVSGFIHAVRDRAALAAGESAVTGAIADLRAGRANPIIDQLRAEILAESAVTGAPSSDLPTNAATIYEMHRRGKYHPANCSSRRGGWCDCGGFTGDEEERAWCETQAAINLRAVTGEAP